MGIVLQYTLVYYSEKGMRKAVCIAIQTGCAGKGAGQALGAGGGSRPGAQAEAAGAGHARQAGAGRARQQARGARDSRRGEL